MIGTLKALSEAALGPLRHVASDFGERMAEVAAAVFLAIVASGFALVAATIWLAERHGAVTACLIMAAVFAALAAIALLAHTARERARRRRRLLESERARAALNSVAAAAAVAGDIGAMVRRGFAQASQATATAAANPAETAADAARTGARAMNPWLLLAGAAAVGYAAARKTLR